MDDFCKTKALLVTVQENGIIRNQDGYLIARLCDLDFDSEHLKHTTVIDDLETERMRLAACGAAALGYFEGCKDEYRSASLEDTLRLYDENKALKSASAEPVGYVDAAALSLFRNSPNNDMIAFRTTPIPGDIPLFDRPAPAAVQEDVKDALYKCPGCGGEADNGHDRSHPPTPYFCSKCMKESNHAKP